MDDINGKIDQLLHQLSQEGLLNDQFQQLMQLQDDANPDFVKVRSFGCLVPRLNATQQGSSSHGPCFCSKCLLNLTSGLDGHLCMALC